MAVSQNTFHLLGSLITFRAVPANTNGKFALAEIVTATGAGAPPNHHVEEEWFLVLEGEVEFVIEGKMRRCIAGDFVTIPTDKAHAFTNVGEGPSRMINITSPGDDHVGFFSQAGEALPLGTTEFPPMMPPDLPRLAGIAAENNMHFLPPPNDE